MQNPSACLPWPSHGKFVLFFLLLAGTHARQVIVTTTPTSIQWTCFHTASADFCCESIHRASILASIPPPNIELCLSQLARVPPTIPSTLILPPTAVAEYSLTLDSNEFQHSVNHQHQYQWTASKDDTEEDVLVESATMSFPFLLHSSEETSELSIVSELSTTGGVHRLLYHQIQFSQRVDTTCYLFLTIPNGMFVDLDDAVERHDAMNQIHAAGVCDIEQPAFVSSQHVIVLEFSSQHRSQLKLASKLHLRYPHPSPTYHQQVFLPDPQLLCKGQDDGSFQQVKYRHPLDHISVAAGNDQDMDMVMWTTITVCLVGVVWMMMDISHIAKWDQ